VSLPDASTASPEFLKVCCADLWAHPGVRLLFGDALRPGGIELTRRVLDDLALPARSRVLDVGCGPGATLGELARRGLHPVGVDYSAAMAAESRELAVAAAGDAERLPFRSETFDAVLMECVLSAVPGKAAAAAEGARALVPGGALVLSDVTLEGQLPSPLDSFAGWIACAAGALATAGYVELLEEAGLRIEWSEDHRGALTDLVAQARRRLALLQGALATNVLGQGDGVLAPGMVELGQALLGQAAEAAADGTLGYTALVARRPS